MRTEVVALTQNVPLNYLSVAHDGFFDMVQEVLGAAAPHFHITLLSGTTIQVQAGVDNDQMSVAIRGRYRYRTTNTSVVTHPGGAAGTHSVYVTGSDNAFTGAPESINQTDTTFGLEIRTSGTPSTAIHRKVAEVVWDGTKITALRQLTGDRRDDTPIMPTAPIAGITPLRVRGATSQTASLQTWENSSGTVLASISASGAFTAASLAGNFTGAHTGTTLGFFGVTPIARVAARTVSNWTIGANARRTLDRNTYTLEQLFDFVATMNYDLTAYGLFQ